MTQAGDSPASGLGRCVAHPARRAADGCPVCGRARCAADASGFGAAGCALCAGPGATAGRLGQPPASRLLRGTVVGLLAVFPGGWILSQYVNVQYMSVAGPAVYGLLAAAAVSAGAGRLDRTGQRGVLAAAVASAVLGTALGFRLFGSPVTPVRPGHQVWLPYVASVVGALVWPLLFGPPRAKQPPRPAG